MVSDLSHKNRHEAALWSTNMHHFVKHWLRGIAPMAIAVAMLTSLTGQAQAGHDEERDDYGWYAPRYGWYGPQYERHDWHGGDHHDWHSGPHFGPHSGPHWGGTPVHIMVHTKKPITTGTKVHITIGMMISAASHRS
jgi:hypothetical protein